MAEKGIDFSWANFLDDWLCAGNLALLYQCEWGWEGWGGANSHANTSR